MTALAAYDYRPAVYFDLTDMFQANNFPAFSTANQAVSTEVFSADMAFG